MNSEVENWIFLGDSLTEGIGSNRISYVSELVKLLRQSNERAVDEIRLRYADLDNTTRFVKFNLAGFLNTDHSKNEERLWIWNLASEGRTIDTDIDWIPLIKNLRPTRIFLLRGGLESIIRPAALYSRSWPFWVPSSWRTYASMDPRCYFSSTWWRRIKQQTVNHFKQRVRIHLLLREEGRPLMPENLILESYQKLILELIHVSSAKITILALPPIDENKFPKSQDQFALINKKLCSIANELGISFLDVFGLALQENIPNEQLFYLDGFHPNQQCAIILAELLFEYIKT